MNTQPEALRLAKQLESDYDPLLHLVKPAAAELRRLHEANLSLAVMAATANAKNARLHEVNQELINAVLDLLMDTPPCDCEKTDMRCPVQNAKAVLEKSRGNT